MNSPFIDMGEVKSITWNKSEPPISTGIDIKRISGSTIITGTLVIKKKYINNMRQAFGLPRRLNMKEKVRLRKLG